MHHLRDWIVSIYNKDIEVDLLFAFKVIVLTRFFCQVSKSGTDINANMSFIKSKISELIVIDEANEYLIILFRISA